MGIHFLLEFCSSPHSHSMPANYNVISGVLDIVLSIFVASCD